MIEVGKKPPVFRLKNQDDQMVNLASLKGQWVVLFFSTRRYTRVHHRGM